MACAKSSSLLVDKPTYTSSSVFFKTLHKDILNEVFTFKEMSGVHEFKEGVYSNKYDNYFMGIMTKSLLQLKTQTVCFPLIEVKLREGAICETGYNFHLSLDPNSSNEWFGHPTVKAALTRGEKFLFIFQNIPYEIKSNKEIHFQFQSNSDARLLVKHFRSDSNEDVGFPIQTVNLTHGATAGAIKPFSKCSAYGVVRRVIKNPVTTSRGTGHGIYALVDPSCYDESTLNRSGFVAQIFTSSVEMLLDGNISPGDVIKLENFLVQQPRIKSQNLEYLIKNDCGCQFVLFRNGDCHKESYCPYPHYNISNTDIQMVERLKKWNHKLMLTQSVESPGKTGFGKLEAVVNPHVDAAVHPTSTILGDSSVTNFKRNLEELSIIYTTLDPEIQLQVSLKMNNLVANVKASKKAKLDTMDDSISH